MLSTNIFPVRAAGRDANATQKKLKTEKPETPKTKCRMQTNQEERRWKTRNGFWAGNKKKYTDSHKSQTRQSPGATARCTTQSVNHAAPRHSSAEKKIWKY